MLKSKWIFVAVLLCVLLPFAANATITRVVGLGGLNTNYIIKDASNPQIWPQLIADWPNLAGAEFNNATGTWDFNKAYLNYSFPNASVLQVSLDKLPGINSMFFNSPGYTQLTTVPNISDPTSNTPASKLSLTWGMPWNGMKVGAALNISQHSFKDNATPANELKASAIGINLGGSFLENKLDAAIGFETVSGSVKPGNNGSGEDKTDGSMAINVAGRYWWMYAEKLALVPNVRFLTLKDAAKGANGDKRTFTTTDIKLGVGHNWTPVENALAIFEFGIDMNTFENKTEPNGGTAATVKNTNNALPYWRIGFETKVFDWLNGRLGAERNWVAQKQDNGAAPAVSPEAGFSQTFTYLGATAYWNRMIFDVQVDPNFILNGPYFISGQTNAMLARVSLKYDFNK
ncbi:MAG TPA: hypothetical protein VGL38_15335 [bacterium]|jgi:hypothetical protein